MGPLSKTVHRLWRFNNWLEFITIECELFHAEVRYVLPLSLRLLTRDVRAEPRAMITILLDHFTIFAVGDVVGNKVVKQRSVPGPENMDIAWISV